MSIKQNGGVFGRNPTFNDVTIEGDLIINGEVFTGLDFQGSWNASTNTPSLASSTGTNGEFYIVSVAGTTDLNGITNWGIGDWAIFNGTVWQRVEGGADGNFNDLTANSLTVNSGTTNTVARFTSTDSGAGVLLTDVAGSSKLETSGATLRVSVDDDAAVANSNIQFRVDGSTKATIDKDGNLDVTGTATMDGLISHTGSNATDIASLSGSAAGRALKIQSYDTSVAGSGFDINASGSAGEITLQTYANDRLRIDATGDISFYDTTGTDAKFFWDASAGNLLVGKTSDSINTVGGQLNSDGLLVATRDGGNTAVFNRKTSDGTIAQFRKDNTAVGNIGTLGGEFYISHNGATPSGLRFRGNGAIIPSNSGGGGTDGVSDLGQAGLKYKDLYLSGGVYLGGTGAANKLDDYEEGTWTPTVRDNSSNSATAATATGYYTKIGREVHIVCLLDNIDTTGLVSGDQMRIVGIPFNPATLSGNFQWLNVISKNNVLTTSDTVVVSMQDAFGYLRLKKSEANSGTWLDVSSLTSGTADIRFDLTYFTN